MTQHHDHTDACGCAGLEAATAVARSLAVPFATVGLDRNVVYLNPAFEALVGVEQAAAVHHLLSETGPLAAASAQVSALLDRAVDANPPPLELTWRSPSGEAVAVHLTAHVALGADDTPLGYLVMARDVTAERVEEPPSGTPGADFELVCRNLPDILVRYDNEGRATYMNDELTARTGRTLEENLGERPFFNEPSTLLGREDYERCLDEVLTTGESREVELTRLAPSGDHRVHSVIMRAERNSAGSITGAFAIGRDVSDLVRARREAAAREQEFRTLAENLPEMVVRYDASARATYVNPQHAELQPPRGRTLLGHTPTDAATSDAAQTEEYEHRLRRVIATGVPDQMQLDVRDARGTHSYQSVLFRAERDTDGAIRGALAISRDVTDLVAAREAIAVREQEFRSLAENLPDLLVRYDQDARATYVNPHMAELLALRGRELMGRRPSDADSSDPIQTAEFEHRLVGVIESGEPAEIQLTFTAAGGEEHVFSVLIRAERDAEGQIRGALAIGRDVTDLVRARQAAAARENEYRSLAENLPDVVLRYDLDGRATYVNHRLAHDPDLPPTAVLGHRPTELDVPGMIGAEKYERCLLDVMATGEPGQVDLVFVDRSGARRIQSVLVNAERDADGSIVGALVIGRDVTELVRARHESAAREQKFRSLAENIPDIILQYDLHGRATYINERLDAGVNTTGSEVLGKLPTESRPPGMTGVEEYERRLLEVIATGEPSQVDLHLVDAHGDERVHSVLFRAERDADGRIVGALAIGRDVTELVRARQDAAASDLESRSLAENLPDALIRYDIEARATYVNGWFESHVGIERHEILGKTPIETSAPMFRSTEYQRRLEHVIATGEPDQMEVTFTDTDGDRVVHSVVFRAERAADGTICGALTIGHDVTELVRARQEIAAREQEFRSLAENLPDVVLRYDLDARLTYVNDAFERQLASGRPVLGRTPVEAANPDPVQAAEYERRIRRVVATGEADQMEVATADAAGNPAIHIVLFRAERDADGTIFGALVIGHDVTDLVRARQAAAAREQEFRSLAENLPDVVVRYDRDTRLLYVNSAFEQQISPTQPLLGRNPLPPDKAQAREYVRRIKQVIATGEPDQMELTVIDANGAPAIHSVLLRAERDATGEIVGALTIGHDVTDLVRARQEIATREHEFRSLAENLPDIVVRYDTEGRATYQNHRLHVAVDVGDNPTIGRRPTESSVSGMVGIEEYERCLMEVIATGAPGQAELTLADRTGDTRVHSIQFRAERDAAGTITGAIAIGRDVTDLVRAQLEIADRERRFRTLAENASDFIGRWDREGRRMYVNPALARLMGGPPDELIGVVTRGGPDGSFAPLSEAIRNVIRTEAPMTVQQRFVDPADGDVRYHEVGLVPEFDQSGSLASVLGVGRDVTDSVRQREVLERLANTDSLTGVASRQVLYARVPPILADCAARSGRAGVLLVDLDGFKHINDRYGHRVGDQLLREVGERLTGHLTPDDVLVRLGGDEFVVVVHDIQSPIDLSFLARDLRLSLAEIDNDPELSLPSVDACIGISVHPTDGGDIDTLLAHADMALYQAKRRGRGSVEYFEPELRAVMERRSAIEQALRSCDYDRELSLHLQPICTLGTDPHVWGAEGLLRWHQPELGTLAPDEFIPIAEECGVIVPIGRWVLRQAAAIAVDHNRDRSTPLRIAVNVSTRQFTHDDIGDAIRDALVTSGCDPHWLVIELTESLLLEDLPMVNRSLDEVRNLGVSIAIDDFGTGYSALQYLTRLQIDHMKIDKAFVRGADVDRQQQEIVRALVAMAHALGIGIVAEGIETAGQAAFLQDLGCRLGQGYLLARPMPVAEFGRWLETAANALRAALPA